MSNKDYSAEQVSYMILEVETPLKKQLSAAIRTIDNLTNLIDALTNNLNIAKSSFMEAAIVLGDCADRFDILIEDDDEEDTYQALRSDIEKILDTEDEVSMLNEVSLV